jgi:hypothetical protein
MALVLAAAEERIVADHVAGAVGFLKALAREIPLGRAMAIYFRTTDAPQRIRPAVTIGALSAVHGEDEVREAIEAAPDSGDGPFRSFLRRLGGRRRRQLREGVDSAAAAARGRVRGAYLAGASRAVGALRGVVAPVEAVQFFLDTLGIGDGWAEWIFHEAIGEGLGGAGGATAT